MKKMASMQLALVSDPKSKLAIEKQASYQTRYLCYHIHIHLDSSMGLQLRKAVYRPVSFALLHCVTRRR